MDFYNLSEKIEFRSLIKKAKEVKLNEALEKLKNFDPMNEMFFKACMPVGTPKHVTKKRLNKLLLKNREKQLKRLLD